MRWASFSKIGGRLDWEGDVRPGGVEKGYY